MFIPNLDNGLPFEELGNFQGDNNRIGYEIPFQLNKRCDVLLVTVRFADEQTTYDSAGFITQYWIVDGVRHQIEYERIWVNTKTIIKIEPLENSLIIFRPVDWLRNWSINLKVRPHTPTGNVSVDLSSIEEDLSLLLQLTSIGFSDLRSNISESFNSATAQRLELLQGIRQSNIGTYTLAEGLADLLPPDAASLNMLSLAGGVFIVCLGVRVAKSPELALKAASVQLNVSSSAKQLKNVSQRIEQQLLVIEAKDQAYQELLGVYERSLKGNKGFGQLQDAIENIEQLPKVENVEELTEEVEEVESKIDSISVDE